MARPTTPAWDRLLDRVALGETSHEGTPCVIWPGGQTINTNDGWASPLRLAWEVLVGEIPNGMKMLRRCGEDRCVNVTHATLATYTEAVAARFSPGAYNAKLWERFSRFVTIGPQLHDGTPCCIWRGSRNQGGYGNMDVRGKTRRAHRVAWELVHGPIPDGLVMDHLCRNPPCVNTAHLEPVTNKENIVRMWDARSRFAPMQQAKTECPHGHPYDEVNTRLDAKGHRYCRECARISSRKQYQKRKLRSN